MLDVFSYKLQNSNIQSEQQQQFWSLNHSYWPLGVLCHSSSVGKCNNTSPIHGSCYHLLGKEWLTMSSCNILCHTFKSGLSMIFSYLNSMRTFSSLHPEILCIHLSQQTECCFIHTSGSVRLITSFITISCTTDRYDNCVKKKEEWERKAK